eukprot:4957569-Pyramimonas_sp.AAC.1
MGSWPGCFTLLRRHPRHHPYLPLQPAAHLFKNPLSSKACAAVTRSSRGRLCCYSAVATRLTMGNGLNRHACCSDLLQ